MIFVTVGAQMSFDRLVRAVDDWADDAGRDDVFAQIGPSESSFPHIRCQQFLEPCDFRETVRNASVIIAHAGMGSILTAMELQRPIIVMPRRGDLSETRNDHQVETAKRFREIGRIAVAMDETELRDHLQRIDSVQPPSAVGPFASPELIDAMKRFLQTAESAR